MTATTNAATMFVSPRPDQRSTGCEQEILPGVLSAAFPFHVDSRSLFPHWFWDWAGRVCATTPENPIIIYTQKYQASEKMIFLHPLKIKPRNPHNLPRTFTFPDWFLNEGRWYQSQQTMNTPILCCYGGDSPSQACSWLKGFHLFQKIVEVWKWRQRLEKFQRPQNVMLVIKAKRKSVGHGLRKGQKFFLWKNQIAFAFSSCCLHLCWHFH